MDDKGVCLTAEKITVPSAVWNTKLISKTSCDILVLLSVHRSGIWHIFKIYFISGSAKD